MRTLAAVPALIALLAASARPDTGAIRGTVSDRSSLAPIAGANVVVAGTPLGAATDTAGRYIVAGLPPGTYAVRVSHVGHAAETRSVTVAADSAVRLDVALAPSSISGEPIMVTATRGRDRETPATFSTLEREQIRDRYTTQDVPVLLSELPSTTFYSESGTGLGYTYLNIRGFDARRVAVMINGVPQNDPEDHNVYWLDVPDLAASLEDIQVQRGAGSAFYGPPAIGGSVNLVTANFARERSVAISSGYGSYNTRKYSASFSSGLVDGRYAFHGRLARILSDGYRERAWVDYSSFFLGAIRYDETMTTQVNAYGGPIADGLAYLGSPKSHVTDRGLRRRNYSYWEPGYSVDRRPEETESFSQPHVEILHEWRLSPSVTLHTTLFAVLGTGFFDYDGSWAPYSYFRLTPAYGFPVAGNPDSLTIPGALIRAQVENRQFGWLPRVTLRHEGGELALGAELRFHRSLHWGRLQYVGELPFELPYDYRYYQYRGAKDMASLYAHEVYRLRPDVTVMLDVQYAYSRYRLYEEKVLGNDFAVPYHFVNPRLGVNVNLDDRWNVYVSAGYTSREPRLKNLYDAAEASTPPVMSGWPVVPQFAVDAQGQPDFSRPLVTPESLFNLELGGGFRSEGVRLDANLYWMEFTDEIVKSGQVDRFGQPVTGNAGRTRHLGLELAGRAVLLPGLELGGNATLSQNRFVRHTDYATGEGVALDGNPIAGFPDLLANLRLTYRAGPVTLGLTGRYVGRQYTDNYRNPQNTVDPFFVSDGSLACTLADVAGDLDVGAVLQVTNLFDRLYAAYGEGEAFFVAAERHYFLQLTLGL